MKFTYSIILYLFVLTACQTTSKSEKKNQTNIISLIHQKFTVELESNPSTGYQWKWINETTGSKVEKIGEEFISLPQKGKVGVGGTTKLTFKGLRKGFDTLKFVYVRPWEKGAQPAKTATFTIEIR
ncbi:MAG: protease inhibitor I42 family protein [Bacteroidales bacterium]|nr:protease inhibitor I42 family protein [Bacteroidales bacterium]